MELVAKKQGIGKRARCRILENLLIWHERALSEGHLLFPKVRRLNVLLSCARQTAEIQKVQVEGSNEEVRNPPGDRCSIFHLKVLNKETRTPGWFPSSIYLGIWSVMKKPDDIIFSFFERHLCLVSSFVSKVVLLEMDDFWHTALFQRLDSCFFCPDPFLQMFSSSVYIIVNSKFFSLSVPFCYLWWMWYS